MSEIDGNRAGMPVERKGRECLGEKAAASLPQGTHPLAPSLPLKGRGKEGEKGRQRVRREPAPAPRQARGPVGKPKDAKKGSITDGQKTAIWTIIRKRGMDTDEFREWLRREFGTGSTRELSMQDAAEAIRSLKVFYGEEHEKYQGLTWGISKPQIRYIRKLARDLGWDDQKRVDGLVLKMFPPKQRVELLNKKEGTALIIALEKMGKDGKDYA